MEREEAIKALKWFKEYNGGDYDGGDRIIDKYGDCYYLVTERDFEAFDMAIKALEQEPMLNKIKAEINNLTVYYTTKDKGINLISQKAVNRIFDKYKAESEDK